MSAAQQQHQAWGTAPRPVSHRSGKLLYRDWTAAELDRLRTMIRAGGYRGQLNAVAVEMGRSYHAVQMRVSLLGRELRAAGEVIPDGRMRNGAEGDAGRAPAARVPRGAPSAAAPGSGCDKRQEASQTAASAGADPSCAISPAAGAASVAPAGSSAARPLSDWKRRRAAQERDIEPAPRPETIRRNCVNCRVAFTAPSRFLFRCEPCRHSHAQGSSLPAQFDDGSAGRRHGATKHVG